MSATDELRRLLDERGVKYQKINEHVTWVFLEDRAITFFSDELGVSAEVSYPKPVLNGTKFLTPEQAIAATLGGDDKLLDLAHQSWSIAICAMQNMPIPAKWGNAVESGLREYGIDVDSLPFVTLGNDAKPCYATDYTHARCKYSVNRGWTEDTKFYIPTATLGGGECKVVASSTDGLTTDEPRQWFKLSCGHAFKLDGLDAPVACPVCGKAVKR